MDRSVNAAGARGSHPGGKDFHRIPAPAGEKAAKRPDISFIAMRLGLRRLPCSNLFLGFFAEEFMHIFNGSNGDDNGGAYDADKEDDFEQPHAEESEEHSEQCNPYGLKTEKRGDWKTRRKKREVYKSNKIKMVDSDSQSNVSFTSKNGSTG
jgi:hypothetical protein